MTDKASADAVLETAVRLLLAEGDGGTGARRITAAARSTPAYPSVVRRERKGVKPIRPAMAYRAKPQRPLRIPGRG
ncbi:hypothetical protein OHA40_09475 [Nocardia sp. NBC_00508]|uniref:hypothetical protein n=1 Tax=Nocardia sp. NBC_00508 TaxID=2975992 RepID=UPI002E8225FC|nr:hypothetical protein [Nocardia sp. NBC_00508]WUD68315.1 hypothetical protein OHA40_09475 [Nocardia sp. NBC_00508]